MGESGDETDYTFNISKEKTSSSATTAPSNCYYNTWQDAPIAPTSTYPYLWMKVVKKTWNESTQSYDSGTASYARITGETGESAPIAYATPEKVTIPCNTDGSVASQITQFISFGMRVGSNDAINIRVDNPTSTPTGVSWSGTQANQGNLTISTSATASGMANGVTFKVTGAYGGKDYVSYVTVALIGTSKGNEGKGYKAVVTRNNFTESNWATYGTSGHSETWSDTSSIRGNCKTGDWFIVVGTATDTKNYHIATYQCTNDSGNLAGTCINHQITKDGQSYCFVFTSAFAKTDENGIVSAALSGYAYKYVGSERVALTGVTIRYGYILNDDDTYATTTTNNSGYFDAGDWFNGDDISTYGKNSPSIFAAIIIGGNIVHAEFITISEKGETGSRGKTGRFYYYAQEWSDDSSVSYAVTDAEAPYFLYNNNYWVFNPTSNGNYTMHQMGTPSSSSTNWKLMVTDFKFIITEAIFGAYAHFGSFIINGDWLISTKGKVYGDNVNGDSNVSGTIVGGGSFTVKAYTLFDSGYPSDDRLEAKVENGTKTISSSEMSKEIMQVSLDSNYVYRLSLSSSHSGTVYIRVRNDSYGSSQLIFLYGTSGTYTATFRVPTTATYIVEIYKSSGTGTATVWNTVVSRLLFSPNYCVDGNSGKSYQSSGVFSGFVKKKKITITTSNMNDYVYVTPFGNELLFERCGTCIELASGVDVSLSLPILSKYIASRYSEQQKDEIRSYIGTKIIIYNKSGSTLNITLNITSTSTYATSLGTGKCACYECSLASETVDGTTYENIKWTELSGGGSIL